VNLKFSDFYKPGRPRYSFEVFPPKDEGGVASLIAALKKLSVFDPAFVSVTYGAMGSTRDLTRDLALRVRDETKLTTAFHFTCVGADRASVRSYVDRLKKEGMNLIVALRGDAPVLSPGQTYERPEDGFSYANELVAYLKEINGFSIAVAGYPEGHIECRDKETDLRNLKRKVDSGADVVITQLFFDNRDYFDFVDRARKIGIAVPIIPGVMPILSLKQIERISKMCGASLPKALHERLLGAQNDPEAMRKVGVGHAAAQCRELLEKGVPGIHFYILNRSESTSEVLKSL
jgi:methylenetetrahydrofolate reductase (NADPH)